MQLDAVDAGDAERLARQVGVIVPYDVLQAFMQTDQIDALRSGLPAPVGLITCDTREQAEARAGGGKRDQGRNAAVAVASMSALAQRLGA